MAVQSPQGQITPSENTVVTEQADLEEKQLPKVYRGGIQKNQSTIHKQIKNENSNTVQNDSKQQSNKQENTQLNHSGANRQWKAEGEGKALLLGFFGIYGTILFAGFLFLCGRGGKEDMKK